MKLTDIENRVHQITWPAPPPNLRARVLSAATVAGQPITWSDRMWFSRGWRLSAVATLIIVAFELQSSSTRPAGLSPTPQALAEARAIDEIGVQLGLPPDVAALLARRTLSAAASPGAAQEWTALGAFARDGGER